MGGVCSSEYILSCVGVSLPKEVYIQNHRLGFLLLGARIAALAFCVHVILGASSKGWLRSELPIGQITAWAESGNYSNQAAADTEAPFCDEALNDKYNYWFGSDWIYANFSCKSLPSGERSLKRSGEIYIPTYFEETFSETSVANRTEGVPCETACAFQGDCPNKIRRSSGTDFFKFIGSMNDFGQCLCKCENTRNIFAVGAESIKVALETMARVREEENMYREYFSTKGNNVLTVVRIPEGDGYVEFKRFQPGEIVQLPLSDWLRLGGVQSLNEPNDQTLANSNTDSRYQQYPMLRITGAEVVLSVNYHNRLDPAYKTKGWDGPVCYIDISVRKVWSSRPVMDWGKVEDVSGIGSYRYRYYYGIRFVFESKGHFSFWNPLGIFTMLASAVVYLSLPNTFMVYFTRYCLGTLSTIYYKAQVEVLEIGSLLYGLICRALVGKAAYESLLAQNKHEQKTDSLTQENVGLHISELFKDEERLDQHELGTINRVFSEGLDPTQDGFITRKAFVEALTNSEECTLQELVDLFDVDASANPCMVIFDDTMQQRRRMVRSANSQESLPPPLTKREKSNPIFNIKVRSPHSGKNDIERSPMRADMDGMFKELFAAFGSNSKVEQEVAKWEV